MSSVLSNSVYSHSYTPISSRSAFRSMTTITSASSAGTVALDLVTDRSVVSKIILSVLCCAQLVASWIVAILYLVNYFREKYQNSLLELVMTFIFLGIGHHLIPGLANAIVYYRRFSKSTTRTRQKMQEENKESWVCLRIVLTIVGLSPVGRYVETLTAIRKLIVSEKLVAEETEKQHKAMEEHQKAAEELARATNSPGPGKSGGLRSSKGGYTNKGAASLASGRTGMTGVSGFASVISGTKIGSHVPVELREPTQRKVRRARRQFRRCEHDGALVALVSGCVGAAPMATLQVCFVITRDVYNINQAGITTNVDIACLVSIIIGIFWIAASLTHFYPARKEISEPDFERGVASPYVGLGILYLSHLLFVALRVLVLGLFAAKQDHAFWVLLPILFHFVAEIIIIIVYRVYMRAGVAGESVSQRVVSLSSQIPKDLFFSYVGIIDFVNNNEGKTRLRYMIHYALIYIENMSLVAAWYSIEKNSMVWYRLPCLIIILVVFIPAFILLQLYYFYYHPNRYSVSICGMCNKEAVERQHELYAVNQSYHDPVMGNTVAQAAVPMKRSNGTASNTRSDYDPIGPRSTPSIISTPLSNLTQPLPSAMRQQRQSGSHMGSMVSFGDMSQPPPRKLQSRSHSAGRLSSPTLDDTASIGSPPPASHVEPLESHTNSPHGSHPALGPQRGYHNNSVPVSPHTNNAPYPPMSHVEGNYDDDESSSDDDFAPPPPRARPESTQRVPPVMAAVSKRPPAKGVFVPRPPHGSRKLSGSQSGIGSGSNSRAGSMLSGGPLRSQGSQERLGIPRPASQQAPRPMSQQAPRPASQQMPRPASQQPAPRTHVQQPSRPSNLQMNAARFSNEADTEI